MSETDSFIEEVTEEVRRDRLFALFRKYGWIAVLLVVVLVGMTAWREWSKERAGAQARAFGDAVSAAQAENDPAARLKALEAVKADGGQVAVLKLLVASAAVDAGDTKTAVAALDTVANDAAEPPSFRDLAKLKRVIVAGDGMPVADRRAALGDLSQAGRPYRPLALEQLALITAQGGDKAAAIKAFKEILQEPDLTPDLRRRATAMIVALGGDPAAG